MVTIGVYRVPAKNYQSTKQFFVLEPAQVQDMPTIWTFDWAYIWERTNFDYQGIVKLRANSETVGLVRYSVYPDLECPKFVDIDQLESIPTSRGLNQHRPVEPIGKWLIWYVAKAALSICDAKTEELISLVAYEEAKDYYANKIGMRLIGVDIIAPGEDGYSFLFSRQEVITFCQKMQRSYGFFSKVA